ncbi:MAG: hypothetical protein COZ06_13775 [Armatimonadetes bacterium CG_4_10_14_3_um_filter_66_18]|nr:hypothetical protein [Armatimonadota bacterium]NCP34166.1 hypothetical protein [Armatimonadota bacterium]OIP02360.1 MAG: hypothetical protein AUJ96_16430 [Armatimonadetes bacterium CG2_30_66_41]PIW13698.1 MAG: hypothetical protein COW34_08270 [Armatimonadetes bacterium CG17_big_fil_post_rev_8_21_14_2_50_66_6]PIY49586.1 MAG: hypothetical protein COZ06_13775 [Armatimonadetes bacterium CG_4_10_14_3_um_filter_66_18]
MRDPTLAPAATRQPTAGLTVRSFVLAVVLSFICTLWVRRTELIAFACQITESTPPITGIAVLLLLALLRPVMKRLGGWADLSRAEMVCIYAFVCVATLMSSVGVVRLLLPSVTAPFYFATPENNLAEISKYLPRWFAPESDQVIRALYEGLDAGERVPWHAWVQPGALWVLFFVCLWAVVLCATVLVRKQWTDVERLSFPLLYFPLELPQGIEGEGAGKPFFRNSLMWVGFGSAVLFNATNIGHALNPAIPAMGRSFDLGGLFTEQPGTYLRPMQLMHRPEIIGLGYLVSMEVLFSVWFCFFTERLVSMATQSIGYQVAGMPFEREQGIGAYLAICILLLWLGRHHFAAVYRKVFLNDASVDDSDEPISYRLATGGLVLGLIGLLGWCKAAGMALWVAALYFALLFGFAVVLVRIRAESGIPAVWAFPYYEARKAPLYFLGGDPFKVGGTLQTQTVWSSMFFLSRGYFTSVMAYPLEFLKMSDEVGMRRRQILWVCFLALIIGLVMAFWMHLRLYYEYGANVLEGGTTEGGYRTSLAVSEFTEVAKQLKTPKLPDVPRAAAVSTGFLLASVLMICRMVFLRFPIHPLGYALNCALSQDLWGAFLITWILKATVLKIGGVRLYRQTLPAFLGLALGHFFASGVVWGVTSAFYNDAAKVWIVWFT